LAFSPALQNAGLLGLTKWRPWLCDERPGPPTSGWPWGLDPEAHVDSLRERQFLQLCPDSLFKPSTYIGRMGHYLHTITAPARHHRWL